MTNLLLTLLFNSLFIFGVFASIQEGMIFEKFGKLLTKDTKKPKKIPYFWSKPLGTCPICMASIYGTLIFWLFYFIGFLNYDYIFIIYICYIFSLSGLNYVILSLSD